MGTASSLELLPLQRTPAHAVKFNVSTKCTLDIFFASPANFVNSRASCNTHQHPPQSKHTHHTTPHTHHHHPTLALSLSMSTLCHREFACILFRCIYAPSPPPLAFFRLRLLLFCCFSILGFRNLGGAVNIIICWATAVCECL